MKGFKKIFNFFCKLEKLIPYWFRIRCDAAIYGNTEFMKFAARRIKKGSRMLDAGAGGRPYEKYFKHTKYESTDFQHDFHHGKHDFICDLQKIPKPDNHYDAIVCTEVLEHVPYPDRVLKEFQRVLKKGGALFLTTPQGWGLHNEPFHFFNFTNYGLKLLFDEVQLKVISIKPKGGMYWYLGNRIRALPFYILFPYLFDKKITKTGNTIKFKPRIGAIFLFPFYIVAVPICQYIIPFIFFYLDRIDISRKFTLGYACHVKK